VAQRTREIRIRMVLGSTVGQAMVRIGRSGAGASVLGLFLGLVLCAGAVRVFASVTLFATTAPTLRIARIDPAKTLRDE